MPRKAKAGDHENTRPPVADPHLQALVMLSENLGQATMVLKRIADALEAGGKTAKSAVAKRRVV